MSSNTFGSVAAILRMRAGYLSVLCLYLLLGVGACTSSQAPETPDTGNETVSGVIQDAQGLPVSEAIVIALTNSNIVIAQDTADEAGAFMLNGLPSDLSGVKLKIEREHIQFAETALLDYVEKAGGKTGLMIAAAYDDDCCASINLTVNGGGAALGDVEIKLRKNGNLITKGYTNDLGKLSFSSVCEGTYNLRIAREGYAVIEENVTVNDCDSVSETFTLQSNGSNNEDTCCASWRKIIVKDSASESVLEGASIRLTKSGMDTRTKTSTSTGAVFNELCEGTYGVRIAKEGYKVIEFSIEVGCNSEAVITKFIAANGGSNEDSCCDARLKIYVKKANTSDLLIGATLNLWKGSTKIRSVTMPQSGAVFEELCEGDDYSVSIQKDGYASIEYEFDIACDANLEQIKYLTQNQNSSDSCCNGNAYFVIKKDGTDQKLSGVQIKLMKGGVATQETTNDNGVAHFTDLCAGSYSVRIAKEGFGVKEYEFNLECNDTVEFSKALAANTTEKCCTASLKLRIKNSMGEFVHSARVKILKNGQQVALIESDVEGWALKEGLCEGYTYTVIVMKDGYATQEHHFTYEECVRITETVTLEED